jgi:predicted enzyme related to lactoylglutathione lyase
MLSQFERVGACYERARMTRFFQYVLRTTDAAAARRFYSAVLGRDDARVVPLHEQALARGARPHWLGFLEVPDVDAALAAFVARGAAQLGPLWTDAAGLRATTVRDPGGALVALAKPASPADGPAPGPAVAWQHLNTAGVERARADYGALFDWHFEAPRDVGALGVVHPFRWERGGAAVGGMSDIVGRPGRHAHWLFHLRVSALDPALEAVRSLGGAGLGPFTLPNGDRVAVCDDAQGAAFALLETPG